MRPGAAICLGLLFCLACGGDAGPVDGPRLDLPPRPRSAPGGESIARGLRSLDVEARERRIYAEVARGNVPTWLRRLEPLEVTVQGEDGTHRLTFWVTPDYLSVGSDDDYFYVPLSPRTALRVADLVGGSLPTPWMVDSIWVAADERLVPIRLLTDEDAGKVRTFERHNQLVQAQRRQYRARPGTFVAGNKLDVVRPATTPAGADSVALYGWHLSDGTPFQPLYRIPVDAPPFFSMGVRLVRGKVLVDGVEEDLSRILHDPELGSLLAGG